MKRRKAVKKAIAKKEAFSDWRTELVEMLEADRVAVIDAGTGDNTVECLVHKSLTSLDEVSADIFYSLFGVCPEDVKVKLEVAILLCKALLPKVKVDTISIRRSHS